MRTKFIRFIFLIILPVAAYSQKGIYVGKPYSVVDADEKFYFYKDAEILTVKVQDKRIAIQKFDAETLSFTRIKVYEDMPAGYLLENVLKYNNRFFVFYSVWDKQHQLEQLFYREIDFDGGAFIGKGERIIKVNKKITASPREAIDNSSGITGFGFTNARERRKFDFQSSYDESKLLIQYRIKPLIKSDGRNFDIVGINVFDKNLDYVWSDEVKMPYTEKMMDNLDYSVDGGGNSYILSTVFNDNTTDIKKGRNGNPNYHIELLRVKAHTGEIHATPIEIADKFINKIWLYESVGNNMVCAGFYNKGEELDDADGVILFKIDKNGEVYDVKSYEIPVLVLNQYESQRTQKRNERKDEKGKAEFEDLVLRELKIEKDGSVLLVGEQFFIREHTYYSNGRTRTSYTYHYNDILVTKISPEGALVWMKKLPKRQVGRNGKGGMSYEYLYSQNKHHFLFLDNERNRNTGFSTVPFEHSDGNTAFLSSYKIENETGSVSKDIILDTRNVQGMELYQVKPGRIVAVSENEFVFEAYKKRKQDVLIRVGL